MGIIRHRNTGTNEQAIFYISRISACNATNSTYLPLTVT